MRTSLRRFVGTALLTGLFVMSTPTVAYGLAVGPPTGLSAVSGNNEVVLSWTAPALNGNPAITDYIIDYTIDLGVTWTNFPHNASTATTRTVTSLTNGIVYTFRVMAFNSDGAGSAVTATATPLANHTQANLATYSACPTGTAPSAGFTDITLAAVDCIKYYGITTGITETTYGPLDPVTRWQMALFLTRMAVPAGVTLGDGSPQGFTDIVGKSAEIQTAINQIKQLGVTVGKTATTFAPDDNVTREEMALFLNRLLAKATPGPGGNTEFVSGNSGPKEIKSNDTDYNFTDITGLSLYESINSMAALWNLGVTESATALLYSPLEDMTRKSMAIMMTNALDHTNARPKGIVIQADSYRKPGPSTGLFSVSHRTDGFLPIANTVVDTFRFTYSLVATTVRFTTTGPTSGQCSSTDPTSVGSIECTVDAADPTTDADGNLAVFAEYLPNINQVDFWAWTAPIGTVYDNNLHAADASKITVETTATGS